MNEFEELYKEYFQRVYYFLYKLCNDSHLTEELTQETFYQALKSLHRFKGNSEIYTWLISIAKHTYYGYLRKNKLKFESTISIDLVAETYLQNNIGDPEDELNKSVVSETIKNMINCIPDKYKDVVMLRVYAQLPFAQVAAALNITEGSAKVIYFRAKKMLMEELKDEFEL